MAPGTQYQPLQEEEEFDELDSPYADDDSPKSPIAPLASERTDRQRLMSTSTKPNKSSFWSRSICQGPRLSKKIIITSLLAVLIFAAFAVGAGLLVYRTQQINGQSPPWYPSPKGGTVSTWEASYKKAQAMVEQMTLTEKVNITTGTGWAMNLCVGNTGPAINVGFPSLCLQDGPLGIRFADHATSFPAGITVGSTWNRDLMRRRGAAHAREAKLKGVHVLLGPAMGPLGRNPAGGRVWEGFGSDPALQAVAAYETIIGIQSQGVMATAKHYVGNEQEHFRKSFEWGLPEALSSNIDDRTMHEVYAWPFAESIRAGVASVMCSYQMVNNSYACANSKLLNGMLKDEMGFQGFVQSDWLAQRSGVASALAGLDMTMPGDGIHWLDGKSLFGEQLTISVLNGSVPVDRINDMAVRIVAAWYQLGQDSWDSEGPNFSSWTDEEVGKLHNGASNSHETGIVNKFIDAPNNESRNVAREVAAEGTVLLKNVDSILPLDPQLSSFAKNGKARVMVVGEDAGPGKGPNVCADRSCNQGTLAVGWGSGASEFMYLVDPLSALKEVLDESVVELSSSLANEVDHALRNDLSHQDLCLVFANADAGEGYLSWNGVRADRPDLDLQKGGSELVKEVIQNCGGPTVIVIHSVGPVIVEEFADLPNAKAIIMANLPGQESGHALTDVLFGKVDASGRLAYTMGKTLDDYGEGAKVLYYPNQIIPQVDFKEGLYIDYRHFEKFGIEPRYAFGYGQSYTTFALSDFNVTGLKPKSALPSPRPDAIEAPQFDTSIPDPTSALYPEKFFKLKKYLYPYISSVSQVKKGPYPYPDGYDVQQPLSPAGGAEGGNPSLFESHVQVEAKVENTGDRQGKEVIQLYVGFPSDIKDSSSGEIIDTPVKVLRNFVKIELEPGQSQVVQMNLTRKDLSYWSVVQQNWIMPEAGQFVLYLGRSSQDVDFKGSY